MDEAISYLIEKEIVFNSLYNLYGTPYIPSRPPGFETLCKLILEQQVSLESAKACFTKLETLVKKVTPQNILSFSDEELKKCSISRQKVVYLKALSNAVHLKEIDLDNLSIKSADEVRSELIKIKGIGNWTIDIYLMFSLKATDIMPFGDIAVVTTLKELFKCSTKEEMEKLSENWKPYRSMATFFLWHHYLKKRNRMPIV
jgi:DNA-3-methyladenine glycosylase II